MQHVNQDVTRAAACTALTALCLLTAWLIWTVWGIVILVGASELRYTSTCRAQEYWCAAGGPV